MFSRIATYACAAMLASCATSDDDHALLTFTRAPAFDDTVVTVDTGTLSVNQNMHFWLKQTVATTSAKSVWLTDTIRCPAARGVLEAADRLELPKVRTMATTQELVITADGVGYSLSGFSQYPGEAFGHIEITSNANTPLAQWVDESLRVLSKCWSKASPTFR